LNTILPTAWSKFTVFLPLRALLFGVGFSMTALFFYLAGSNNCIHDAAPWWPLYGLAANFACYVFIATAIRKERLGVFNLIGYHRLALKKDLRLAVRYFIISFLVAVSSGIGIAYLLYGRYPAELIPPFDGIPPAIMVFLVVIFPPINSVMEEITYNGFIFPRLELMIKNTPVTLLIVLMFFTLQHIFIMFVPDVRYLIWRLLSFVPLLFLWILLYVKMRRLTTVIMVHWIMDTIGIVSIMLPSQYIQ